MSNTTQRQILNDGWRNAVVKFTGVIDTADVSETPAIRLSDLLNNEQRAVLWGLRVDEVQWSMSDGLEIALEWNSGNPQQITPIAGRGSICFEEYGGAIPDSTLPGFDGAINLRTQAFPPGTIANFTVVLELVKLYRP